MTEPQGTHFWHMVIQVKDGVGVYVSSFQGTWTPNPGATRLDTFNALRNIVSERDRRTRDGVVIDFDIQPNQL